MRPINPSRKPCVRWCPASAARRLRGLRGVEALLPLVPGLVDDVPDLAAPTPADPGTERYALFDAVVALLEMASAEAPVVLILDDLHWAAKPTLLLLRHLLRFGDRARVQVVGTYRSTDLDRSHPLAAMLADLHRDGTANRISLSGLDEDDVSAYVEKAGYDDAELGHALASVTGGNPFFLIEALRHVDESGGVWDPSTLPHGVREAVSRRLSRLPIETNKALAAAAVVGSRFALDLVERVVGDDLVDAFDEASKAGIVIEEPGGRYRFNHAIVRQSLLAELPSMRRMRLHQRIATTLEGELTADDELLAELAHHYFECAWAGNAAKAVEYCRRAADQAMARLAYEGAADLYDQALHALEELDDELPDRDNQVADLLVARCEALLAAGDVASAAGAVSQLQQATVDSARLSAWATCFDGQLSVLVHPERLDDVEVALGAAAHTLAEMDDAAGEAKAHTVRATCLARLGRIGECEVALDDALTAARRAREHRRVNAVLAGAPLAALWGPNPVPRAGGRCLDVVRLLRITTDSPAVEATSTRCQAVLEAFRGRDAAARRMIDSARRTVTELGLRHALLEVEQFAGIVELVLGEPANAEPHLRQACNGFRRMGLDADTAETAALLGRACLALDRDAEADELCTESQRLAGHALKASIAWRTLRAQLFSRSGDHDEARRVAQAAVALAERTDGLVDHGDACLSLAKVLVAAGDAAGARAAAERATDLYERKGAATLVDKARSMLDERVEKNAPTAPAAPPVVEAHTAAVQASERAMAVIAREAWDEFESLSAPESVIESRRKVVGFKPTEFASDEVIRQTRRDLEAGIMRMNHVVLAVRGERVALARVELGTADTSPGAPQDEFLQVYGVDDEGRINLQVWFDLDDMDAALAELDAVHARLEAERSPACRLENAASWLYERFKVYYAARDWSAVSEMLAEEVLSEDRRHPINSGVRRGRDALITEISALAQVGIDLTTEVVATRGERLVLSRIRTAGRDQGPDGFGSVDLDVIELGADGRFVARIVFDEDDFDVAIAELDARYLSGEAAAHARTWSAITGTYAAVGRCEFPAITPDCVTIDHRRTTPFGPGELSATIRAGWDRGDIRPYVEAVHRLSDLGAVCSYAAHGVSHQGFDAEWQGVNVVTVDGDMVNHTEFFDEADIDLALARFDQLSRPTPRLANAASRMGDRLLAHFAADDWDAMAEIFAENMSNEDRRRLVSTGVFNGRDAQMANMRAVAELWSTKVTRTVMATRGRNLSLARVGFSRGEGVEAFRTEFHSVIEINAEERISAIIVFDVDDFNAAIAELDARYLAGEAAAHARTWSAIAEVYAALNRGEMPAAAPDLVDVDHRSLAAIGSGDLMAYLQAASEDTPGGAIYIETVHRLTDLGAVTTHVTKATSQEGFDAEWRITSLFTVGGDLVNRYEIFDEADLDTALARFEELQPRAPRPENTASRTVEQFFAHFEARDWDAMAELLAEDVSADDRRSVVNAGIRRGRDLEMANWRATEDLWTISVRSTVALRGERLALVRFVFTSKGGGPQAFSVAAFAVVQVNDNNRIAEIVVVEGDDTDAAFAELDARYLAGEAAAQGHIWSVIAGMYTSFNRHELPATTPDWVTVDRRPVATFEFGDANEFFRSTWDLTPRARIYAETVHRLTSRGAVVTHVVHGTSEDGFDAEWRQVGILTVEGDRINHCELFDEPDLDAALARFDELQPQVRRLENAAIRVTERLFASFAASEWDSVRDILADDFSQDDRRRVVGAGVRHGREDEITDLRAIADLWAGNPAGTYLATRGERLDLMRLRFSLPVDGDEPFVTEGLGVGEINADGRVVAAIAFDPDDIDAAFDELNARYLAGEAAAHADTWSVVSGAYASMNRHELFATTPDWVNVDHRRPKIIEQGGLNASLLSLWSLIPDVTFRVEAVHRLTNRGAVCTHVAQGISQDGFDAEWRGVELVMVDGDLISRCEIFDVADLDAALARFKELERSPQPPHNAATRTWARLADAFNRRDLEGFLALSNPDIRYEDRRRVLRDEFDGVTAQRKAALAMFEIMPSTVQMTAEPIAVRGSRLSLIHVCYRDASCADRPVTADMMQLVEVSDSGLLDFSVSFDLDDVDSAFAELDARYLAGEAAEHARTWSVMTRTCAAFNRGELPATTPDSVFVDHRPVLAVDAVDLPSYLRVMWDLTPDIRVDIEAVHRLSELGAVLTHAVNETSPEGFNAEWRGILIYTLEADMVNRCEIFDEADLDAALARFHELSQPAG